MQHNSNYGDDYNEYDYFLYHGVLIIERGNEIKRGVRLSFN